MPRFRIRAWVNDHEEEFEVEAPNEESVHDDALAIVQDMIANWVDSGFDVEEVSRPAFGTQGLDVVDGEADGD